MLANVKAMIVVVVIATAVFIIAKPLCLRFIAEDDFARRRNVWFALTLTAFLSPSFWLYVLVALPVVAWSARRDTNPLALYVLVMQVIPPINIEIPMAAINLFELNNFRILAFAILIPAAWSLMQSKNKTGSGGLATMDVLIVAFVCLQLVLFMPTGSITNTMRSGFLSTLDVLLLYFVVSRACIKRRVIVETMASFCLASAIFAPLALFESLWGWLLYEGIGIQWGSPLQFAYAVRSGILRAQVSTGHALALGNMMAIAFGFWLYLRSRVHSMPLTVAGVMWMWMGLLAAYSRGPWLAGAVIFFAFLAAGPNASGRFFKAATISALIAGVVLVSPIGARIIDNLPFVGTVDAQNVIYRQRLVEISWELIWQNPYFGSPFVVDNLEALRQGQGIIDLLNVFLTVALFYGLVGLALFVGFFLVGTWNAYQRARRSVGRDPDLSLLGASLVACMCGLLLMMATGGYGPGVTTLSYVVAGLATGYARLELDKAPAATESRVSST